VIKKIIEMGKKKIGILGFSFKAGTDDLRESPVVEIIETLLGKGFSVKLYDRKELSINNLNN
jgi:GDP-mannose 6-dehydrogenase